MLLVLSELTLKKISTISQTLKHDNASKRVDQCQPPHCPDWFFGSRAQSESCMVTGIVVMPTILSYWSYLHGLVQDPGISSASGLEIPQSCTKPSICFHNYTSVNFDSDFMHMAKYLNSRPSKLNYQSYILYLCRGNCTYNLLVLSLYLLIFVTSSHSRST